MRGHPPCSHHQTGVGLTVTQQWFISVRVFFLDAFNARVGRKQCDVWSEVRHSVGQVKVKGLRLLSLCAEHNLIITNTLFQLKTK